MPTGEKCVFPVITLDEASSKHLEKLIWERGRSAKVPYDVCPRAATVQQFSLHSGPIVTLYCEETRDNMRGQVEYTGYIYPETGAVVSVFGTWQSGWIYLLLG